MFAPQFPYKGNQIIISSGRVLVHSKDDAVFILGKQAVSLSSPKTINLDASIKILINSTKIELGDRAETLGQPVILGRAFSRELKRLVDQIYDTGVLLAQVSESDLASSMFLIQSAGKSLANQAQTFSNVLQREETLSKNTFTR